ncbi:MAG: hypothetical protein ACREJC_20470, partial [Tepidisphaeraceae bacterium]
MSFFRVAGALTCAVFGIVPPTRAVITGSSVASYAPGGDASLGYRTPESALGLPNPIADPVFGNTILSPFNPPYLPGDIVIVGDGGQITLALSQPVAPNAGPEIGVFVNNGLIDVDYPHGQVGDPAGFFSDPPRAIVKVSANGVDFVPLNVEPIAFDIPSNYYADLGSDPSNTTVPGSVVADFSRPFAGTLADFDGLNWTAVKSLLDGTAAGTWLEIGGAGLPQVNYVRFEVPSGAEFRFVLDAVTAVPE